MCAMQAFCGSYIKEWYTRTATSQRVPWVTDLSANFKSCFPKDANSYLAEKGWQLKVRLLSLTERSAVCTCPSSKRVPWQE